MNAKKTKKIKWRKGRVVKAESDSIVEKLKAQNTKVEYIVLMMKVIVLAKKQMRFLRIQKFLAFWKVSLNKLLLIFDLTCKNKKLSVVNK